MKASKLITSGFLTLAISATATAAPFGSKEDTDYAGKLWQAMSDSHLVGKDAIISTPYAGTHPHGAILDTIDAKVSVGSDNGVVIVKRNYGGEGISKTAVANAPEKFLKAVTVMFKRPGYDTGTKDWFWVKYAPNGRILSNPKGMALAGKVGKGGNAGCVACHKAAPGGDLVFNHDRYK